MKYEMVCIFPAAFHNMSPRLSFSKVILHLARQNFTFHMYVFQYVIRLFSQSKVEKYVQYGRPP